MKISGVFLELHRCGPIAISLLALSLATVMSSSGCGKRHRDLTPLIGKVFYQGKPLQFGSVMMEHKYGQPATAAIQPDGTFAVATIGEGEGAVVGKCRVRVACFEGQDPAKKASPDEPNALGRSLIPERYSGFETSGLAVEVRPGANEPLVLNLTK